MRFYKNPKWFRRIFPDAIWDFSFNKDKVLYLTFDDGPDPETTPNLLKLLASYDAKATFFCSASNAQDHPELIRQIIAEGHQIGNHGLHHLNGWQSSKEEYLKDVTDSQKIIDSNLFRPPYGKLKPGQFKAIKAMGLKVVFWSVMSYDFDESQSSEQMTSKMKQLCEAGDIVVFHDKKPCQKKLMESLPHLLEFWTKEGYQFRSLKAVTS